MNMDPTYELKLAKEEIHRVFRHYKIYWMVDQIRIIWNERMKTTAGRAHYQNRKIELNPSIWDRMDANERRNTAAHEAAHVVCTALHPRASTHGPEWKKIMWDIGHEPSRCHTTDTTGLSTKAYPWYCPCGKHLVTARKLERMKKAAAGGSIFHCRKCRYPVAFEPPALVRLSPTWEMGQWIPLAGEPPIDFNPEIPAPFIAAKFADVTGPAVEESKTPREELHAAAIAAMPPTKVCPKCHTDRPKNEFGTRIVPSKNGPKAIPQSYCIHCRKERS